jgi:uncharacterized membrane protein YccC
MKTLYSILSFLGAVVLGYTFLANLKYSFELNYILFMSMLAILFFIFVILSVLSTSKKPRSKSLFYNSYSNRRTKNEEFDKYYSFLKK